MRSTLYALFAAAFLIAACESTPETADAGAGTGAGAGAGAGIGTGVGTGVQGQGLGDVQPGSQRDLEVNVGDRVFFDTDRSDLKPEARETLDRQAQWLRRFPNVLVNIEGHADERGTREYNLALAERRAIAARNYLIALGIPANRLGTISYGKERPSVVGSNEAAYAQNRRAVTTVN